MTGIDRAIWVWGTPEEIKKSLDETYPGPLDRAQKKGGNESRKSKKEGSDAPLQLLDKNGQRQVLGLLQTLGRGATNMPIRPWMF